MAFKYKVTGSISRPTGAVTDYPCRLVVGESAGSTIGSELVTNGGFNSSTLGWTEWQCTLASVAGGQSGNCLQITNNATVNGNQVYQNVSLQYGHRYRASCYVKSGTSGNESYSLRINDTAWGWGYAVSGTSSGEWAYDELKFVFLQTGVTPRILLNKNTSTDGTMLFDSISLVEIPDVHCSGHCRSDFGDIRFYDASDNALDYWIDWGTLTGTTPNQSVEVWVNTAAATDGTTVKLKYGDAALDDGSCAGTDIFIKFKDFESGSDGDSIATADGDWTVEKGTCEIDTAQKYSGTRSAKMVGGATAVDASIAHTAGSGYAIRSRFRKTDGAGNTNTIIHGNGTKRINVYCDSAENIKYQNAAGGFTDTDYNCAADTWGLIEVCNIDFTAGTCDIWHNGTRIAEAATMQATSANEDRIRVYNQASSAGKDAWIDDLIVRKYANPEPVWGAWGEEETEIELNPSGGPAGVKTWNDIPSANIKTWNDIPWDTIKTIN